MPQCKWMASLDSAIWHKDQVDSKDRKLHGCYRRLLLLRSHCRLVCSSSSQMPKMNMKAIKDYLLSIPEIEVNLGTVTVFTLSRVALASSWEPLQPFDKRHIHDIMELTERQILRVELAFSMQNSKAWLATEDTSNFNVSGQERAKHNVVCIACFAVSLAPGILLKC